MRVLTARRRDGDGRVTVGLARMALATALGVVLLHAPAYAQGADPLASQVSTDPNARLLVEADELVYDNDSNTVSAVGNVEMNYDGRTLQADRVVYDRDTSRVFAEGNARLTQADGTIVVGERFELTDDFSSGFIDSLRVEQPVVEAGRTGTGRFTAPRAERIEGRQVVFQRGTYTTCEPCAENPSRPPLWQVKAARIIHDNVERTIYYENATVEFAGVPVAYLPYFWSPDPSVRRKTGFLAPTPIVSSTLGNGARVPFFINLAPNYDLTLRPAYLSRQGVLADVEWRHRLLTGSYAIRAVGIFENEPEAFNRVRPPEGYDDARGMVESVGRFSINPRWNFGWDVTLLSDRFFLEDYDLTSENVTSTFRTEAVSTVYMTGQGERSFFDARGYYFEGLSEADFQKHQPVVHPVVDYDRRFAGPGALGGEIGITANFTSLTREAAMFQPLGANSRTVTTPGLAADYTTCVSFDGDCLAMGLSGSYTRVSAEASWRRRFIDAFGQSWTPFAYLRTDGVWFSPSLRGYENAGVASFTGSEDDFYGRAMPAVGLEYRYPLAGRIAGGTQVIEPIAQIIARPNEMHVGQYPNEDAQSLVFDDTNLFEWDKFSGFDRAEGGVRANYGIQYTFNGDNGVYVHALFGQSVQLAGQNSFDERGLLNVGAGSGLDDRVSDYVGRIEVRPYSGLRLGARARFDRDDFSVDRIEADLTGRIGNLTTSVLYARLAPQPDLGFTQAREGVNASARLNLNENWYLTGGVALDIARYRDDPESGLSSDAFTSLVVGAGYIDECTSFTVALSSTPISGATTGDRYNRKILARLEFFTLGEVGFEQRLNQDGQDRPL
ncbi:LPS-assembly protein LptD [Salinarimonas ramus]|uniref:LPS-assembly protein LptD n=1 Tax=Salinarimonas ramus TaxID=690164 RepID=A0A917Q7G0_9HYPH|nr:LPS-assembly protein LptD [Salinarimonas ramus]GGK31680.1 LPS-assembly protein LptD [Salinarimonas ramus]